MKHKFYKKPTITIVQLRQQCHILTGSEFKGNAAGLRNYKKQVYEEDE